MKSLVSLFIVTIIITAVSCSGSQPTTQRKPEPRNYPQNFPDEVVVIVDGNGDYGHKSHLPPGQAKKIYGYKSAKPFAPGQRKKLEQQYGFVPPLIIHVPERLYSYNQQGAYYIYNNFWYWKKDDGYFHLNRKSIEGGN